MAVEDTQSKIKQLQKPKTMKGILGYLKGKSYNVKKLLSSKS